MGVGYLAAAFMSCTVVFTTVPPPPAYSQGKKYKCLEIRSNKEVSIGKQLRYTAYEVRQHC